MELVKKVCKMCYKKYETKRKQQRYCSLFCSYKGKNKMSFNLYIDRRLRQTDKENDADMALRRMKPDNDLAGLRLDKENYQE